MKLFDGLGPNPQVVRMFLAELGMEIETVTTVGFGSVPQVSTTQVIAETTGKVESAVHQLPIPLLAGILLLGT